MSRPSGSGSPIAETLGLFLLVAAAQFVTGLVGAATGLFVLTAPVADDPWTIVTSVYAHDGPGHLLSNSVGLVLFGWPIARATTRARFHAFFVVTGALAGVSQIVTSEFVLTIAGASGTPGVLGASGAVFALMGYLLAGNRISEGLAARVEVPTWFTLLVFVVLAVGITLATAAPRVALVAHFTGFLLGLVAGRARVLDPGPGARADRSTAG